jgi:spermidine synthase
MLLDVDNGPESLVYDTNARLYRPGFLQACRLILATDGVLAIWSADPAPHLQARLSEVFERLRVVDVPVLLGHRRSAYTLLLGGLGGETGDRLRPRGDTVKT